MNELPECNKLHRRKTWTDLSPSGYTKDGVWTPINCETSSFKGRREDYVSCLRNFPLIVTGDSNTKLFVKFIRHVLRRPESTRQFYMSEKWDDKYPFQMKKENITISWHAHELPYFNLEMSDIQMFSPIANILDGISANKAIILIHYWLHISRVPISVFRNRVHNLIQPIKNLLERSPEIKVAIKGPHSMTFYEELSPLDYLQDIHFRVWKHELGDLIDRVIYIDQWDMTLGYSNIHHHPPFHILSEQVRVFMSYVCTH